MSGESVYANEIVEQAWQEATDRSEMDSDAMGRALIQAVVERYLKYRTIGDVGQELEYLVESMDDDEPVVTRGC
ncbi:MAG: hypothetical protein KBT88_11660 [Gammaproteobacteria bacterium]|nr:hypothetical protein [Gammaproteobacteria bacterium]MBQ0840432.1 hypothetical protein [Gammaproteobacteria bacterium]